MPGHIAPAYVAVDANSLITAVTAEWFGGCKWQRLPQQSVCAPLSHVGRLLRHFAHGVLGGRLLGVDAISVSGKAVFCVPLARRRAASSVG